jgi:hypothetical protein
MEKGGPANQYLSVDTAHVYCVECHLAVNPDKAYLMGEKRYFHHDCFFRYLDKKFRSLKRSVSDTFDIRKFLDERKDS